MQETILKNADDFGMNVDTNKAIKKAILAKEILSVSVMATGEQFEDAVAFLRKHREIAVGLHFDITEYEGLWSSVIRLIFFPGEIKRVKQRLVTQYNRLKKTGLAIDHIDSHEHIHAFPSIFRLVAMFAKEKKILRVRHCAPNKYSIQKLFSFDYYPKRILIMSLYYLDYLLFERYLPSEPTCDLHDKCWNKNGLIKLDGRLKTEDIYHLK